MKNRQFMMIVFTLHLIMYGCSNKLNISFQYEDGYSYDDFISKLDNERFVVEKSNAVKYVNELSEISLGIGRQSLIDRFGDPNLIVNFSTSIDGSVVETLALTYFINWCEQCLDDGEENTLFILYINENDELISVTGLGEFSNLTKGAYPVERGTYWRIK